jgi:HlyD family secretion protein
MVVLPLSRAKAFVLAHKAATFIAFVVLLAGGWYLFGKATTASAETRYVVGQVERGTVVSSVSASGQISASHQIDLKPEASGKVTYVGVKAGQAVKAGQLLVRLDSGDTAYELESARLDYQKLLAVNPTDLRGSQDAVSKAEEDLASSYASARSALIESSSDSANVMADIRVLLTTGYVGSQTSLSAAQRSYRDKASKAWYAAQDKIKAIKDDYHTLSADTPPDKLSALLAQAYDAATAVADAAKYTQDAVALLQKQEVGDLAQAQTDYATASEAVATANATVSSISSAQQAIVTGKRTLTDAQSDLADLQDGPDQLDARAKALAVSQKAQALADYSVYAPFDGVVASVDAQVGDSGSSGTAVATIITTQQIAKVSLNEVDAAKVKAGQKATLTFDAIEELTLTGTVVEVDAVGAVSSGVVSYGVQIALDAQDSRIKPGMTVNASIQTETAQDALVVPASAVKTANGQKYVLAFETPVATSSAQGAAGVASDAAPIQIPVEVGISDDTSVEILSGLTEGEQIITRTIAASSAATASATTRAAGTTGTRAGGLGGSAPAGAALRAF